MPDYSVFSRLKQLFSTNTIVRNVGGKKLRVVDSDQIQSYVNRKAIDRYNRVYTSNSGGYGSSQGRNESSQTYQGARLQLFRDYDMMDSDPIIASVLDIYADESTVKNEFNEILGIRSKNQDVQEILHNLFYDILNVEFNLWPWVRNMVKYGDFFLYLNVHPDYGIVNVFPFSIYDTIRVEGEDPNNPFAVKFRIEKDFLNLGKKEFETYEIAHFRLLSDNNFLPYGKSMIENGRRVWKQLQLMEDAMLIHRIMRAPDKRQIRVDIGNIPPAEIDAFMNRIIDKMKKTPLIDKKTGDYDLRFNMMNITEDIYLPVRGKDSGTSIENLPGLEFNAIEDIEYLRKKLMAAFKVPKAFLGYEEDVSGKATLAAQDMRFARTIERIQRIIVSELTKIAIIHLYAQGYRDEKLVDFTLIMASPSTIYEQEKIALWKEKIALSDAITNSKMMSREWIYNNILGISDEEMGDELEKIVKETKMLAHMAKMEADILNPPMPAQPAPGVEGEAPAEEAPQENSQDPAIAEEVTRNIVDVLGKLRGTQTEEIEEDSHGKTFIKKKTGRPAKGYRRKVDSHPLGRDPLGNIENRRPMQLTEDYQPVKADITNFVKSLKLFEGSVFQTLKEEKDHESIIHENE